MALTLHGTVADNTAVLDRRSAKPLVINGDMQIAQRGTSVTGISGTSLGYKACDRWRIDLTGIGEFTAAQTASAPDNTGLVNSYRLDCTTAETSPGASEYLLFSQFYEGQDVQLFKKGTSYAEKMTVAFWVKSNKTGTYVLEVDDNDNSRNINQAYTISSANTWEKKVLSFAADTTGTFDNDNANSMRLRWWLAAGSDYTSGTLQTAWGSTVSANRGVGIVNLADSTDNDWSITGIQLEVGEFDANSIAPFQHESFGDNLRRCQRYYEFGRMRAATSGSNSGNSVGTSEQFAVYKRAAPTVTSTQNSATNTSSNTVGALDTTGVFSNGNTSGTAACIHDMSWAADAEL